MVPKMYHFHNLPPILPILQKRSYCIWMDTVTSSKRKELHAYLTKFVLSKVIQQTRSLGTFIYSVSARVSTQYVLVFTQRHPDGVCSVAFKEVDAAVACQKALNGRWFACRAVHAEIWDGVTNYQVNGGSSVFQYLLCLNEARFLTVAYFHALTWLIVVAFSKFCFKMGWKLF